MIDDDLAVKIARAFWRRIEPYKSQYDKELPYPLPVEFLAHMSTALTVIKTGLPKVRGVSIDTESPSRSGVLVTFDRELTPYELRRLSLFLSDMENELDWEQAD